MGRRQQRRRMRRQRQRQSKCKLNREEERTLIQTHKPFLILLLLANTSSEKSAMKRVRHRFTSQRRIGWYGAPLCCTKPEQCETEYSIIQ
mmetsp:Transcript_2750/g.7383  ORF Transcript_2750/g.7383 Transcript_2750/m.7383 type:complete len:90 (+) Transcript_2750:494-763(+)